MTEECGKCTVIMKRVGYEEARKEGVVVTYECPACHFRTQKTISRFDGNKPADAI
jgi:hypothetical protein